MCLRMATLQAVVGPSISKTKATRFQIIIRSTWKVFNVYGKSQTPLTHFKDYQQNVSDLLGH